ncbi:MAG: RNA polymerase Rpb4 family protein [Candidatus Odinarchaeia archaeon]
MVREKLEEIPLTLAEVKNLLQKREKEGELSYVQRVTLDYVTKMTPLTATKAKKLTKELIKIGISKENAIQIVNALPDFKEELSVFLTTEEKKFTPEEIEEILKKIKEYK